MDLLLQALSLLAFLLSLSLLHLLRHQKKPPPPPPRLPPGSLGLPLIGHTPSFLRAQRRNRLFQDFLQPLFTKHGPIFKTRLMGHPTVIVSGANANRFFLSSEFRHVVSSWPDSAVSLIGRRSIMEAHGARHKRLRVAVLASMCPPEALALRVSAAVHAHLDTHWRGRDSVKLFDSMKRLTFSVFCECFLGVKEDFGLFELFECVLGGVFAVPFGWRHWRAKRARAEIERRLVALVRERAACSDGGGDKEKDLMGRLMEVAEEGGEREVVDNLVLLVFAAHDTTSIAISMVCRLLFHHPDCLRRLLQEQEEIMREKTGEETLTWDDIKRMTYTWQVAQESMRLFPPIFGSFRKAIVDIQFQGYLIPKGWKVLWTTYGTHYDPQYFPNPESFDPNRFEEAVRPYVYLPFGGGPRLCAGFELAKMQILVFMHMMVTKYDWSLVYLHEPITIDPLPAPLYGMPINIYERNTKSN